MTTVAACVAALGLLQVPAFAFSVDVDEQLAPVSTSVPQDPVATTTLRREARPAADIPAPSQRLRLPDGGALPAPAVPGGVTIVDGGDGYLNASEVAAVTVIGTYDATDPSISAVIVRITNSAVCGLSTPGTATQNATLNPDGTWSAGPFDLSGTLFAEGVEVCARARAQYANSEQSEAATSNTPIKDTIAPDAGAVAYEGPYALDGYVNITEAAAPDPDGRPVTWSASDLGAAAAEGRFTDPSDSIIIGGSCGIFALGATGTGYLNSSCMSVVPQGEVRWQARWRDAAGNWSDWVSTSILVDTIAPPVDIDAPIDGDTFEVGATVPVEGFTEAGLPLSFDVDGDDAGGGTAAGDGSWATAIGGLSAGVHTFTASVTDIAGNVGTGSVDIEFDANIPIIITPVQNAFVPTLVTIGGTSDVGSTVEVFEGASLRGTTQADGSGEWALVTGLTEGIHSIRARGTDMDGNVSIFSSVRTFTVDAVRPTLTIDQADPAIFPMGTSLTGTAGDDDGVARIEIGYFNALGGKVLTQDATCATCGAGGLSVTWTAEPELLPGLYRLEAVSIDVTGNRSPIRTIRFITL